MKRVYIIGLVCALLGMTCLPVRAEWEQPSLPVVYLEYTTLSKDVFHDGQFRLVDKGDTAVFNCEVRHRGKSSTLYEKKSYAIKLLDTNHQKKDTSFLGMRSDNYWILDAMACDKARMRNRVAMDLWLDCSAKPSYSTSEREICNGYRGQFVEVYVNGSYEGLYCFMERVDRKQLKLKQIQGSTVHGVLYKSINWDGSFFGETRQYDETSATWMRYEYKYPDMENGLSCWEPLYRIMDFVNTASPEELASAIEQRLDMPVFIDYYLFVNLLSARDNYGKNLYLSYRDILEDSKLLITPWDIDHSFGRQFDASEEEATRACWTNDNHLYQRLEEDLPQYREQLVERYAALRETWWTLENLKQRFASYFQLFRQTGAGQREEARWSGVDGIGLDFQAEEEYIYAWLEARLAYTDSVFSSGEWQSLDEVSYPSSPTRKIIRNGQILILRDNKTYTLTGQETK